MAALAMEDAAELLFFLERGRAVALLEGLKARETLWAAVVPAALRAEETTARAEHAVATKTLVRALGTGDLAAIRQRRAAADAAAQKISAVVARIQREAKAGASIAYSEADGLAAVQARLAAEEALVLYALTDGPALALVLTRDGCRMAGLGASEAVADACRSLPAEVKDSDPRITETAIAKLRGLVVDPLGLQGSTTRLLISPHGALSYVPFSLLAGDREVAYVPSGTTYGLLLGERGLRGKSILAIGDPDYDVVVNERSVSMHRGGGVRRLVPLPATRKEVEAIGDVKILSEEATESGVAKALQKRARWRAVHFACHGLIDPDRPMLSSLALTADREDDGFLTCLDVFRMEIPADLVVLSACETGKGRIYKTEGIVGLTRAFMFAGAPRVICSLWKVDDEATRALMIKFYELWNPKDGEKGLGAAAALKKAQEFVRSHEEWKHPYYWAAWVLWGLPK